MLDLVRIGTKWKIKEIYKRKICLKKKKCSRSYFHKFVDYLNKRLNNIEKKTYIL